MKKVLFFCLALGMTAMQLSAQTSVSNGQQREHISHPFYIGVQGSVLASVNENTFSYVDNHHALDLFTPQGGVQFGYYFNGHCSLRVAAFIGQNASAANTLDTAGNGFYPYKFKSTNVFLDFVVDFKDRMDNALLTSFFPKAYVGVGYANTFGFTDTNHPWQKIDTENIEFGFRLGLIGEFEIDRTVSFIVDLCAEGYGDQYNGLQPTAADQAERKGYAGFPLDLRFVASIGVLFHL